MVYATDLKSVDCKVLEVQVLSRLLFLGPVTQLIECFLCKEEVAGLNPVRSIQIFWIDSSVGRAFDLHSKGHRFKSYSVHIDFWGRSSIGRAVSAETVHVRLRCRFDSILAFQILVKFLYQTQNRKSCLVYFQLKR